MFRAVLAALTMAVPLAAQQPSPAVTVVPVAPGVHMLVGNGGNIGVSSGPDGVFLIDDQYAPATEEVLAAIRTFSDGPVRFVLNTHWHGDHTGGNEHLGGVGALVVAHDNVRRRMSTEQFIAALGRSVPASPAAALPVVTFSESVTFHLNGDELYAFHVPHAHTDGDAVIQFRTANVLHMGDTFFNGAYPFIDLSSGGNVRGMIAAAERGLALADADTRIIPGHGPLGRRADLVRYRDLLVAVRDRVQGAIARGMDLEAVKAAGLTREWDATWGTGFIEPGQFVTFVYESLQAGR